MLQQNEQPTQTPTDYELMQLYRDWWEGSYGTKPNSQATIVAAAFARHVLETHGKPKE